MKFRRLLGGAFARTSSWSAAAVGVSAITGIVTARVLGPESRGSLALVLSIAGLSVLLGALGTNVSVRRHLPRADGPNTRGYELLTMWLVLPVLGVLALAVALAGPFIGTTFLHWSTIAAFVTYGLVLYVSNQLLDYLNAVGHVARSAKINAAGSFVCMLFVATAGLSGGGVVLIIYCYAASVTVQVVLSIRAISALGVRSNESARGQRVLLADGVRLLGLNLGQNLTYRADSVFLGALASSSQVGIYAVAITPAGLLRIPANALGQLSFFAVAKTGGNRRSVHRRLALLLVVLLPVAAVGWLLAPIVLPLVYGVDFADSVGPLRLLLLAELCLVPFLVLSRALAARGSAWRASGAGIVGLVVRVVACLILIPGRGAAGAALASVFAYATMSAVALVFSLLEGRREAQDGEIDM